MKVAVSSKGRNLDSKIEPCFERSPYLLIVETEDFDFYVFENNIKENEDGTKMAKAIIDYDCEVLITGEIKKKAFEILVDNGVTRHVGTGYTVKDAISLMEAYQLEYIKEYKGNVEAHYHSHE